MGNLTYLKPNGEWGIEGVDLSALPPKVYGALCKLRDIEHKSYLAEVVRGAAGEVPDNYKELIERLKIDAEWAEGQEWEVPICLWNDLIDAVSALAELTEENAKLHAKLERTKAILAAYSDTELEQEERQNE